MSSRHATATVLPRPALDAASSSQLADRLAYADPDAVVSPDATAALSLRARGEVADRVEAILSIGGSGPGAADPVRLGDAGVDVVVAATDDDLAAIRALEREGRLDPATETYVLSDRLAVEVEPTTLSSRLAGREAYVDALEPDRLEGSYTHLTTEAPAGYRREWDGLTVVGCGAEVDAGGARTEPAAPTLRLSPDGTVTVDELSPSRLGLRAIRGVGETTARRLREADVRTREAVAGASVLALARLDGVSTARAERLRENARAVVDGEVVRRGDEYVPSGEPVFVDIETDGLSPTVVWLVGVLDRTGEGNYTAFCQRDPDAGARALGAFLDWYGANAAGRPIVAYNGLRFDFPVIREHVERDCPRHRETWDRASTFDPYSWAVRDGNAVLPGLTNRLEDVAAALGRERDDTGLTGAEVARRYRRWARERTPEAELDWERHERYCEGDVRALAAVYDALGDARRTLEPTDGSDDGPDTDDRSPTDATTQGTLSDF